MTTFAVEGVVQCVCVGVFVRAWLHVSEDASATASDSCPDSSRRRESEGIFEQTPRESSVRGNDPICSVVRRHRHLCLIA